MACLLIVDDSKTSREGLLELLSYEGYQCQAVGDGDAALRSLKTQRVDLILLDIAMPGVSGLHVLDEVRRQHSAVDLPVIMVTGQSASQATANALDRGANDYVTKPLDLHVLLARIRTQLQLRDLGRLKDEFLSIASHDLKNPLTAILALADLLAFEFPVGAPMTAEGRWGIETIARRSRQMNRLITDFLDMRAAQDGHLVLARVPTDLRQIAEQAVEDNRIYSQSKGIELALATGEAPPLVPADPARLAQVVDNLVGNAIKFGSSGGRIELATRATGEHVALEVRDNGPGLSGADLGRLFIRHARLGNHPTGGETSTGLGLAWCKQLVELHGGRIGAHNGEQGGAVFWFELPREQPPAP
ncbi:MAG TPA: response regulator [Polyangia bacterium]|jgi:signal transduction histidine kinase|nr:response regulator [Polyangia bacterium]